jgi:hypothetical protein
MIVWSLTELKSRFTFRIILLLGSVHRTLQILQ